MEEDVLILLGVAFNLNLPLLTAWLLDHWLGDPAWLPHPVVAFGKAISFCEHRLNRGDLRFLKGAFVAVSLVLGVYVITLLLLRLANTGHCIGSDCSRFCFLRFLYSLFPNPLVIVLKSAARHTACLLLLRAKRQLSLVER